MVENTITNNNTRISVAMCSYNGEKYMEEQLESIINQTVKVSEIIICDDCSNDGTGKILNDYQARYPELMRVIHNEINLGYVKNFEKAIINCTGDIIFLSDQDDVWRPDKVEKITNKFHADEEVTCVFSNAKVGRNTSEDTGRKLWDQVAFTEEKRRKFSEGEYLQQLIMRNVVTGATMAFKGSMVNHIVPIPEKVVHDAWISFICALYGKIKIIDEPLILYRQHENQQIGATTDIITKIKKARTEKGISILQNAESSNCILEKLIEYKKGNELEDEIIRLARDRYNFFHFRLENKKKSFKSYL